MYKNNYMASYIKQKAALKGAVYAFVAGAHYMVEHVDKSQSISVKGSGKDATEAREVMLEDDFERFLKSPQSIAALCDMLDEEDIYPYGTEWPREAIELLLGKLIAPKLTLGGEDGAGDYYFRFKKGFKELATDLAHNYEALKNEKSQLDHWLTLILNMSFHAGVMTVSQMAENTKLYQSVVSEVEEETEPWGRYPQISELMDKQLARETKARTGLVSDFEDY